jgi:diguanylate cyclase (GGDEF)-like protein
MPNSFDRDSPFRAGVLPETRVLLAGQDLLTGLSSRAGLDAHYQFAVARARRSRAALAIGVAVLDVDPAAPHDDVFGHDLRIIEVARRLRAGLRETDLIARLGETRFAFVAEAVTPAGIQSIAHRVSRALAPGTEASALSAGRVGIALREDDTQTLGALLRSAEEALSA